MWWFGVFVLCVVSFDCFVCSLVILFHQEAAVCMRMLVAWVRLVCVVGLGGGVCCVCWWFVVGKLLRAHGGCLGIESR